RAGASALAVPARARARACGRPFVVRRAGRGRARRMAARARPRRGARVPEPRRRRVSRARRPRARARGARDRGEPRRVARSVVAVGGPLRPARHLARLAGGRPPRVGRLTPRITVVGSINLDLVARCEQLPQPGETVTDASFARYPGGKGANQAVACARLGAAVTMIGAVGSDPFADEALTSLREAGVVLEVAREESPTGVAVILVDGHGENVIVVASGANAEVVVGELPEHDAVLCQLEIP